MFELSNSVFRYMELNQGIYVSPNFQTELVRSARAAQRGKENWSSHALSTHKKGQLSAVDMLAIILDGDINVDDEALR